MNNSGSNEEIAVTVARLESALDSAADKNETDTIANEESDGQSNSNASSEFIRGMRHGLQDGLFESFSDRTESAGITLGEQFSRLLGEMVVRKLTEQIRDMRSSKSEADTDDLFPSELLEHKGCESFFDGLNRDSILSKDDIENGQQIIEESKELLETINIKKLSKSINMRRLPKVINFGEVPAAIANADPKRAVELKHLASLVEFDDLWDAVEVREFMRNKDELEDTVHNVVGDTDSDDGDGIDGSSLTDSLGSSSLSSDSEGGELGSEKTQAMQVAIQSKLRDAVEEFRSSVLDAREQVEKARDKAQATIEETTDDGPGQPSSRNPTAYSTMVSGWKKSDWSAAKVSTVPHDVRHSSAPGHIRLYGSRFDKMENDDE